MLSDELKGCIQVSLVRGGWHLSWPLDGISDGVKELSMANLSSSLTQRKEVLYIDTRLLPPKRITKGATHRRSTAWRGQG